MRKHFADLLYKEMKNNKSVYLLTADLGFGLLDKIRQDFPARFFNVGAAEQCLLGVATGLALSGKTVFAYSITPFLLFRAAETIRNYINHEEIPVKLIGSGRGEDYSHDGFSHHSNDDSRLMLGVFNNVVCKWPVDEQELSNDFAECIISNKPYYINLKR